MFHSAFLSHCSALAAWERPTWQQARTHCSEQRLTEQLRVHKETQEIDGTHKTKGEMEGSGRDILSILTCFCDFLCSASLCSARVEQITASVHSSGRTRSFGSLSDTHRNYVPSALVFVIQSCCVAAEHLSGSDHGIGNQQDYRKGAGDHAADHSICSGVSGSKPTQEAQQADIPTRNAVGITR
jgi:hypothetical protein